MSKFIQLDDRIPGLTPRVRRNEVLLPRRAEIGAYGHWLLGPDSDSLTAIDRRARVLTAQSDAPTYSTSFLTMDRDEGRSLLTDLEDTNQSLTMWVVFRIPTGTNGLVPLCGNADNTSGNKGRMIYIANTTRALGFWGNAGSLTSPNLVYTFDEWHFAAVAVDTTQATNNVTILGGGQPIQTLSRNMTAATPGTAEFALGNTGYLSVAADIDFAEFGVLDYVASAQELADIYTNSQARMTARGVTLEAFTV
jgi:hypothetical protein